MAGILSYALTLSTSAFSSGISSASGMLRGFTGAAGAAGGAVAKIVAPIGALAGGVSVFAALNKAANFEQLRISMEVLTGSVGEARKLLDGLKADSNKTPFEFGDYAEAGKILIALGGSTKEVRGELQALGDIASGLNIPLTEMATAYGKARNDGVLYMETLNQFNDKGIPVLSMLASKLNLSTSEVKKLASEGGIGFGMLQQVIAELTGEGGKFFGMMEKQSHSTKGLLGSLKSALDELLVAVGTPINDFLKPMLEGNLERMQLLNQRVAAFFKLMAAARDQGKLGDFVGASLKLGIIEGVNVLSNGIRGSVAYLAASLPVVFREAVALLTSERASLTFQAMFGAIGDLMRSKLEAGAASIAGALGRVGMEADLRQASRQSDQRAGIGFNTAKAGLAGADFGEAIDRIGKALTDAHTAGVDAARAAASKPLIDPKIARDQWKDLAKQLDPKALEDILRTEVTGATEQVKTLKESIAKINGTPAAQKAGGGAPAGPPAGADAERQSRFRNAEQTGLARQEKLLTKQATRPGYFSNAEKIELENLQRKFGTLKLGDAAAQLGRGAAAADPARGRRAAAAEAGRPDPLLKLLQGIHDKFANLATA